MSLDQENVRSLWKMSRTMVKRLITEKGFPPALYYKATNSDHIAMLGREAQQAQKKRERTKKKKEMPTTAARQSADDPPPLRPPESSHHRPRLRSTAYQAAPPRRDATPTTLLPGRVLGFLPARGREWGMDTSDTLQEGMVAPAGVTASRDFFLDRMKRLIIQCYMLVQRNLVLWLTLILYRENMA